MRDRARRRLDGALHSDRFRALLLGVARCAHHGAWRRDGGLFTDFALDTLEQRLNSVRRKRKAVRGLDAHKRHRLRIKAKKLRYMFEFLKPVASRKAVGAVSDQLERLQILGTLNDVIAGERLLGQLVEESQAPAVNFAADLVREAMAVSPKIKRKAIKTHADLRRLQPFEHGLRKGAASEGPERLRCPCALIDRSRRRQCRASPRSPRHRPTYGLAQGNPSRQGARRTAL